METDQTSKGEKSLSILERFRQLSKDKEKEKIEIAKAKPVQAIYFSKNDDSSNSRRSGNDRGWKRKNWNEDKNKDEKRGWKRKNRNEESDSNKEEQKPGEKTRSGELMSLNEADVGITEYISKDLSGFSGIIKQRFSDFNVNEIGKDGTVIKLTTQDVPEITNDVADDSVTNDGELLKILQKEQWDDLYSIVEKEDTSRSVEIEVTNMSRDDRVKIHNAVRALFKNNVHSNTNDVDGKKILKISYIKNENDKKIRRSWKNGEFLHFVLYKENSDTTEVINLISSKLRIKANQVMYAGIKDKRARTTQAMCIKRMPPAKLASIQPFRSIVIGNYCFKEKPLRLGALVGNRFRLAIRNVTAEDSKVAANMNVVKEKGFINYFGLQRFGQSVSSPTYAVGKAIVNQDWKAAVDILLRPRPGERSYDDLAQARVVWQQKRCAASALKALRWHGAGIERRLWTTLAEQHGNAYLNALESLPRATLSLYCHAFQSLIWNRVVSRRLKQLGLKVLPGDLVYVEKNKSEPGNDEEMGPGGDCDTAVGDSQSGTRDCGAGDSRSGTKDCRAGDNQSGTKDCGAGDGGSVAKSVDMSSEITVEDVEDSGDPLSSSSSTKVRTLTEEEARVTSFDQIVLPLPGSDIQLPDNVVGEWYKELLAEEGVTLDSFKFEGKGNKCLTTMYGTYRNVIARPQEFAWKMVKYQSLNDDLLNSELDEMRGSPPIAHAQDGPYKALLVEFSLGSSSYATMLLREVMRCETSTTYHAGLTSRDENASVSGSGSSSSNADAPQDGGDGDCPTAAKKMKTDSTQQNGYNDS